MNTDRVEALLKQFPGPVTLEASWVKKLIFLFLSAIFTGGGIWLLYKGSGWTIWLVILFFGLCTSVYGLMLFPGKMRTVGSVRLDADGFQTVSLAGATHLRWADMGTFEVVQAGRSPSMIKFDTRDADARNTGFARAFSRSQRHILGINTLSVSELGLLMNRWRALALARSNTP